GRVMVRVKLINNDDRIAVRLGGLRPDQVRTLELDMLVDTGATTGVIPEEVVEALGLPYRNYKHSARLADGSLVELGVVGVAFEILGREELCSFWVLPRGASPLLGQVPLELLDLVVTPSTGEVTTNPAHGGQWIGELLSVA
ncbi:MAG TPA: aspartyl protease family protein, partial [Polyangiaceae bacterium]